ncbi:hypothetical protein [Catenulispora subtropica]|uniref:Uncharacterized protein n=1 Tax=Catenulispora subtropica TaxID=450798 RepID=A0ABN2R4Z1_9ACTN
MHSTANTHGAIPGWSVLDSATAEFGIPKDALVLALRFADQTPEYPVFPAAENRLKVYLDLKDWVSLAKARLGRPQFPADQVAYEMLRATTAAHQVIAPLSATTYMEVAKISSLRQRTDLTDVITEISGFATITGRWIAVDHQLRTALAARYGGDAPAPIHPFGLGAMFAFGDSRVMVLKGKDAAVPGLPADVVKEMETTGRVLGEYMLLRGALPEDLPELRKLGYQPEAVAQMEQARLKRETDLAAMVADGTVDRSRLGNITAARHMFWELRQHLVPALADYGVGIDDFFDNGAEWLTAFLDDIPSAAVDITLHEKGFRNSYKKWTGNDVRDADALSAAIPYCQVVMTDKYAAAQLATSSAASKQGTLVLSRLSDLNAALPDMLPASSTGTP